MDKDEQVRQIKKLLHRLDSGTNVDAENYLRTQPTRTWIQYLQNKKEKSFSKDTPTRWIIRRFTSKKFIPNRE